jgi:hypothetical protein
MKQPKKDLQQQVQVRKYQAGEARRRGWKDMADRFQAQADEGVRQLLQENHD